MNKRTAKRIRQNNHRLYHESVKRELKFKEAVKALHIDTALLTKGLSCRLINLSEKNQIHTLRQINALLMDSWRKCHT